MLLTLPVASWDPQHYSRGEPGIEGLVDLVNWEVWRWSGDGGHTRQALPVKASELESCGVFPPSHPILPELVSARTSLLENLSMFSEELMDTLLNLPSEDPSAYLGVHPNAIITHLRSATLRNHVLPVICGSAFHHIGTELVMNYVGELLPSPVDVVGKLPAVNAPLRMLAWKVGWDKRKGWMTFVRVYSGTLKSQSVVMNTTRNKKEKISKLLLLYAAETEEVDTLSFGSVGVVLGLKYTRTGDTLVATQGASSAAAMQDIIPPPAVMSASVIPESHSDLIPVQEALESLSRTDPSVRIDSQEGQLLVHGLGALHLEIVENRLRDEWNAKFEFGTRRVSYREGLNNVEINPKPNTWRTDVGGKSVKVIMDFTARPLEPGEKGDPLWDGNLVVYDKDQTPLPPPDSWPNQSSPWANIARGIFNSLSNSPNTSLPLSHIYIHIEKYRYPEDIAPTSVLAGASAVILRDWVKQAGTGPVMEPYISLKVTVNEETLGKVVKDLTEHDGEVLDLASGSATAADGDEEVGGFSEDGVYVLPELLSPSAFVQAADGSSPSYKQSVYAVAPLSQLLDYSNRLRALSGGHGLFEMANDGFREVSDTRKMEILREIGRA